VTHSTSRSWTRPICSATSNASAGLVEAEPRIEPGERLDRQQVLVALEPPDRLEHGAHRALGDGVAQRLRALAGDQRDVLRDLGEPDRHLAAAALGLVEGAVGLLAQDLGVVARPQLGGADADRHLAVAQRGHEPPRGGQGARLAGAREQQGELVAADPEGAVALAAAAQHLATRRSSSSPWRCPCRSLACLKSSRSNSSGDSASPWRPARAAAWESSSWNARWLPSCVSPSSVARCTARRCMRSSRRPHAAAGDGTYPR
jgi:hypothetical protein